MLSFEMTSEKSKESRGEAVEAFVRGMTNEVNAADVSRMMALQQHMMTRFEKTNEMLLNFNRLSDARYELTQSDFRKHIHLLHEMRKDLDNIFRRIRVLKHRLSAQYPEAFKVCEQVHHVPDDDVIEEEEAASAAGATKILENVSSNTLPTAATDSDSFLASVNSSSDQPTVSSRQDET